MSQGSPLRAGNVTLNNTPLSAAKLTGLVAEDAQVRLSSTPMGTPMMPPMATPRNSTFRQVTPSSSTQARNRRLSTTSPRALIEERLEQERENELPSLQDDQAAGDLLSLGYTPSSKITVQSQSYQPANYIKAVNQKGQTVFVLLDAPQNSATTNDLTLIESKNASIVPYSLKNGAINCAGRDVCGIAFECGNDALCTLIRSAESAEPQEGNFLLVEQHAPTAATLQSGNEVMPYPVVKLSEIKANPGLVLRNTDQVTRRLRNASYISQLQDLSDLQQAIIKLGYVFTDFNATRERIALELNRTLTQLEEFNQPFLLNPPTTEAEKRKFQEIQYNLIQRNQWIARLLQHIRSVAEKRMAVLDMAREIEETVQLCNKEFANIGLFNVP